jgi:hypothetical protein
MTRSKIDLSKLPSANGAAFDSHLNEHDTRCLSNTRVELQHRDELGALQDETISMKNDSVDSDITGPLDYSTSSSGSKRVNKSTTSGFSGPIGHVPSLDTGMALYYDKV